MILENVENLFTNGSFNTSNLDNGKDETIKTELSEENLTEEQFNSLRPNFNIPELGKFAVTYEKYKKVKRGYEYFLKLKEQLKNDNEDKGDKATVQSTGGD